MLASRNASPKRFVVPVIGAMMNANMGLSQHTTIVIGIVTSMNAVMKSTLAMSVINPASGSNPNIRLKKKSVLLNAMLCALEVVMAAEVISLSRVIGAIMNANMGL